MEEENLNNKI